MADIIQLRRDTTGNWSTANPILADGELGIETDSNKGKLGNGITPWNSLAYTFTLNGGFLGVPQNAQSGVYTLVIGDIGKHIFHPTSDATPRTWTIPSNASVPFPIGSAITFVNQNGAGVLTIAITTDIMRLAGAGTLGSRTLNPNGVATALKITATEWIISGSNLT